MATIQVLLDIETQIETAVKTHLVNKLLPAVSTASASTPLLDIPRVEVESSVVGEGPHQTGVGTNRVYDQFSVTLEVRLLTSNEAGQNAAGYRGLMRAVMMDRVSIQTLLSNLFIAPDSWQATGGARQVYAEEGVEEVSLTYAVQVFVKPSAWPASIVPV